MTEPETTVMPRRVGPATRVIIAVLIGLLPGALFVPLLHADPYSKATSLAAPGALAVMALAMEIGLNQGYAPRLRGSVLVVWTLLGRQTVDLSALVAVGCHKYVWNRRPWLRLSDPMNMITIRPPLGGRADVRNAMSRAVWEAAGRGVSVAPDVPEELGLPPLPGMMDRGTSVSHQLVILGLALIGVSVSAGMGVLVVLLSGG
jgi:hypothetical protein